EARTAARLPRGSVFITNVVKCRPPANRGPRSDEVESCRPYLMTELAAVRPKVVVTLGSTALKGLLGKGIDLKEARGKTLVFGDLPVLPTCHPAAILYNRRLEPTLRNDLRKAAKLGSANRARIRSGPPRKGSPRRPADGSRRSPGSTRRAGSPVKRRCASCTGRTTRRSWPAPSRQSVLCAANGGNHASSRAATCSGRPRPRARRAVPCRPRSAS